VTTLTVNPIYSTNSSVTICDGNIYAFNAHNYSTAGTYRDTLHAIYGCDSIIVTTLTVNSAYHISNLITICEGDSYTYNLHNYITAGTYHDTLFAITGCDSIIVTTLTVNAKPITSAISGNANPLMNTIETYSVVNTSGSNYQWLLQNGVQQSGTNSYSITVLWNNNPGTGTVRVVETNTAGCRGDTISNTINIVLPVSWLLFDAMLQKGDVSLTWSTASELNNKGFYVERSSGESWEQIGFVKGGGTVNRISQYQYTDRKPVFATHQLYYRLRQVDFDGIEKFSPIVNVTQRVVADNLKIYPNPTSAEVVVELPAKVSATLSIAIYDMAGRIIMERSTQNWIEVVDLSSCDAGVYQVRVIVPESGEVVAISRLVKE
jgi:hypothetical protein